MSFEIRTTSDEVQVRGDGESRMIGGHAMLFDVRTEIGGMYIEQIARGACEGVLDDPDIRALWNHEAGRVLGRVGSGTLRLSVDDRGLMYEVDLPDSPTGNDAYAAIKRKDVTQSSFGFRVAEEKWTEPTKRGELPTRTILRFAKLRDVSPVTYPAYSGTDVAVRSMQQWLASRQSPLAVQRLRHRHALII